MIANVIRWSVANRLFVIVGALALLTAGLLALRSTAVDALPDLSDTQVIVRTSWPGQAPQIVENQVTYPLTTTMLSVPGAKTVRGYSFFGDSFVYVIFEDGTDLYWARSRVLEYLNQVQGRLPAGAKSALGPDATGVGWIYEYALVDKTGQHDLSQLRSIQDWFLRYELKTIPGIAEVASIGGMVKQYQVLLDPVKLAAFGITQAQAVQAIQQANQEAGGSVLELAEADYIVRASGYLKTLDDFRAIPLRTAAGGIPVTLGNVATIQIGPEIRQGVAELNGDGEVAGGVVILRQGKNAREVIAAVKEKLAELKKSLPPSVEIVTTYDRSQLIDRAVDNLSHKLIEEFLVVAIVCALFLWHVRSALVAILTLPLGVLAALLAMHVQGVNANIMSLGGLAIAIGAMVDAAVVMIENAHKHLEHWHADHRDEPLTSTTRWQVVTEAAAEVGPALFFSLLIITLSFVPVFTLEAQEGRLFAPLAFTKTYAMAAAAILSVTLVPVLMGWLIRGHIPAEQANPVNRFLTRIYRPALDWTMRRPKTVLLIAGLVFASTLFPLSRLGGEFLPNMDEGDLLYMPSALPGLSVAKASELLQQTSTEIENVGGSRAYSLVEAPKQTVSVGVPVELGGKRSARIAVADAQGRRAAVDQATAEADLRLAVTKAYVEAVAADRRLATAREKAVIAGDAVHAAHVRVTAGRASPLEEQRADVLRVNADAAVDRATRLAELAHANLFRRMGQSVPGSLDERWFDRVDSYGPARPLDVGRTLALAAARSDEDAATAQVKLARSQGIPDVTLSAGARRLPINNNVAAVFGISVPLPLFNGGTAAVDQANAEQERASALRRVAELDADQAVAQAKADVANAAAAARAASGPALASAEEAARIARIGYREGKFGQLDLIDAERTLAETRAAAIDALAAFHDAQAELDRLTTTISKE